MRLQPLLVKSLFVIAFCLFPAPSIFCAVVVTEIMYHPASGDENEEFIEILNTGETTLDLSGWRFTRGIAFVFPEGVSISPRQHLVIAADPDQAMKTYNLGQDRVLGPWRLSLANRGEAIELRDDAGGLIDAVAYQDGPPWPIEADGAGSSLECINPLLPNDTARNWAASIPAWTRISYTGTATSNKLFLYLLGPGTCLIDDVSLTRLENGADETNLISNGGFSLAGIQPWQAAGNHTESRFNASAGHDAPGCLMMAAQGAGDGSANGLIYNAVPGLVYGDECRLDFWIKPLGGGATLVSRLSGNGLRREIPPATNAGGGTPGRTNSTDDAILPPLVAGVTVSPAPPINDEPIVITAVIEADGPADVALRFQGTGLSERILVDDGVTPDATAGDGVYTVSLPGFPAGDLLRFDVQATVDGLASRLFSSGFGVAATPAVSDLPTLWLFVRDDDWQWLNANIWTETYVPALVVYEGRVYPDTGLRFRGGRPRLFRKKSLKLRFDHGRFFQRNRLNLNAAAMDDDYMTEPMAYEFYRRSGLTVSDTRFVSVHLNGEFWGLFIEVEQVNEDYLRRWGLDPDGALYKAVGVASNLRRLEDTDYDYATQYEKKTRLDEPYDDLIAFINGLYTAGDMEVYLDDNLEVASFAKYLAATNLMAVWDSMQHNYYIYRPDEPQAKWRIIPWDLDHAWGEWEWRYFYDDTYPLLMGHEQYPFAGAWYTWNKLWTVFLDVPRFRGLYLTEMRTLLNTCFTEWHLFPMMEEYRQAIASTVALDEAKWPDHQEPLHAGPYRTMAGELPLLMENISKRRRFVAGLLDVTLLDAPQAALFRRGDLNVDNAVNLADVVMLLTYLFSDASVSCLSSGDINDDSVCNLADPVGLLAYLFADGVEPAVPFRACGADPTPDSLGCESFPLCVINNGG